MLSKKYLNSVRNLSAIIKKITETPPPEKFTIEFLKNLGFHDTNDRAVIGLLKDLHFLTEGAVPTPRYHQFLESGGAGHILAEALREAYSDIFLITSNPSPVRNAVVRDLFRSRHNVSDQLAGFMSNTFFTLLDLSQNDSQEQYSERIKLRKDYETGIKLKKSYKEHNNTASLCYNIEIHLPVSREPEVYDSIFKSMKEHLLNDE